MEISIKVEELRKRTLFIGTPMYGGKCDFTYCKSMTDLVGMLTKYQIKHKIFFLANESLIQRARNYITDEFMRSGLTHMIFIDSDIGFDPNHVMTAMALAEPESEYDILGGPYPKKCISWEKIKRAVDMGMADQNPMKLGKYVGDYVFNPVPGTQNIQLDKPVEVLETGTGFMMIQRQALEKFADAYPELMYTPDHVRSKEFDGSRKIMRYFDCEVDPKSDRYLSEDYWFCQKAREAGIKVWLMPWMNLNHSGTFVFDGSLVDIAAIGETPTAHKEKLDKWKGK